LNLYLAIAEMDKLVSVATPPCAGTQWKSAKSNATTQKKIRGKHTIAEQFKAGM